MQDNPPAPPNCVTTPTHHRREPPMKRRTKTWLILATFVAAAGAAAAIWSASVPQYATATLTSHHMQLRIEYPRAYSASVSEMPDSVVFLTLLSPTPLQAWINASLFRMNASPLQDKCFSISWKELTTSLKTLSNHSEQQASDMVGHPLSAIGTLIQSKSAPDGPAHPSIAEIRTFFYHGNQTGAPDGLVTVYSCGPVLYRASTIRTIDDVVSRMELISVPPSGQK